MKAVYQWTVLSLLVCLLTACAHPGIKDKSYKIGFSAEINGRFFITRALFDQRWQFPVGNIGCCHGDAGTISGTLSQAPKQLLLEWLDKKTGTHYQTLMSFPLDLSDKKDDLPAYYLVKQQKYREPIPYIVTSISANNSANSWLSNARSSGENIKQRVLLSLDSKSGQALKTQSH